MTKKIDSKLRLKNNLKFLNFKFTYITRLITKLQKKGLKIYIQRQLYIWFVRWQKEYLSIFFKNIINVDNKELRKFYQKKIEFINFLKEEYYFLLINDYFSWKISQFNIIFRLEKSSKNSQPYIRYLSSQRRSLYAVHILSNLIKLNFLLNKNLILSFNNIIVPFLENNLKDTSINNFKLDIYSTVLFSNK